PLAGHHLVNGMALAAEARDRGIPVEVYLAIATEQVCQGIAELVAIAQFIGRTVDGAGQAIPFVGERRFKLDDFVRVDRQERYAVVGQHLRGSDTAAKVLAVTIKVKRTTNLPIVGDRLGPVDLGEKPLRVKAQAYFVDGVYCRAMRRALSEKLPRPAPGGRAKPQSELEPRVATKPGLQKALRCARTGPSVGMAGRDHAGVGEARLHRSLVLAVDNLPLVPVVSKKIGGGGSNNACPEHKSFHGASLS